MPGVNGANRQNQSSRNRHSLLFMNSLLNTVDSAKGASGNELMESNE